MTFLAPLVALFLAAPLASPARIDVLGRILALEDQRSSGGGELGRYLADPDRSVRRRAALAAGRIGDVTLVPALVERMNDAEPEVRQMSAFALGLLRDRSAADRLVAALADPDTTVRARSLEALGRIGDRGVAAELARHVLAAAPHGAALVTVRGDDPASVVDPWFELRLGLFALAALKDPQAAETVLLNAGRPRFDWWAATWAAMRLESPRLKPLLVSAASSSDPLSRAFAARGLGALKDPDSVDLLGRLVRDPQPVVARAALRALAVVGDPRGASLVAVGLASADLEVAAEALRALAALPADRSLEARIVPFLGHEAAWVRAAALPALARTDPDGFLLVLSGMDPDPEWSVRAALATALAESGTDAGLDVLFAMLRDEDPRVLPAVLQGLRKRRGRDATDTLRRHLQHPDASVRAVAVEELASVPGGAPLDVLWPAYQASPDEAGTGVRLAVVATLAADKGPRASELLAEVARTDPSRVARERAAGALRERGAPAPAVGAGPPSRLPADYRSLMQPVSPYPGLPLYTPRAILHTRRGQVEVHLNVVEAPLAVDSFAGLAQRGYFDGSTFHRVVPDFVAQGGDPRGDGSGGPGYSLRDEVGQRPYGRGVVGMALAGRDTGGSQFFVTRVPAPHLDGTYPVIGRVVKGMEVVDALRPGDVVERVELWDGR